MPTASEVSSSSPGERTNRLHVRVALAAVSLALAAVPFTLTILLIEEGAELSQRSRPVGDRRVLVLLLVFLPILAGAWRIWAVIVAVVAVLAIGFSRIALAFTMCPTWWAAAPWVRPGWLP